MDWKSGTLVPGAQSSISLIARQLKWQEAGNCFLLGFTRLFIDKIDACLAALNVFFIPEETIEFLNVEYVRNFAKKQLKKTEILHIELRFKYSWQVRFYEPFDLGPPMCVIQLIRGIYRSNSTYQYQV